MVRKNHFILLFCVILIICTVIGFQSTQSAKPEVSNTELAKSIQELQREVRLLREDVEAIPTVQLDLIEREIARLREEKRKLDKDLEESKKLNNDAQKIRELSFEAGIRDLWIKKYINVASQSLEPTTMHLQLTKMNLEIELKRYYIILN